MLKRPENYHLFRLMAADPGLNNTGVAEIIFNLDTNRIESIYAETLMNDYLVQDSGVSLDTHAERTHKLLVMKHGFSGFVEDFDAQAIACEAPFFDRFRPMAYGYLLEVVNNLREAVIDFDPHVTFTEISPLSVKSAIGAKAVANDTLKGKELVKAAIQLIPEVMDALQMDFDTLTEHAIDAIAVGYAYLLINGFIKDPRSTFKVKSKKEKK